MFEFLDRLILELELNPELIYQTFSKVVESASSKYSKNSPKLMGNIKLSPNFGDVCFGSALHGWGFTLKTFAKMYTSRFGISVEKMGI